MGRWRRNWEGKKKKEDIFLSLNFRTSRNALQLTFSTFQIAEVYFVDSDFGLSYVCMAFMLFYLLNPLW